MKTQGAAPRDAARGDGCSEAAVAAWRAVLAVRQAVRGGAAPPLSAPLGAATLTIREDGGWASPGWPGAAEAIPGGAAEILDLYLPFALLPPDRPFAVAHLAQSLDGRIATHSGASRWITGSEDILHTHRMRALADAVIVGAGTVANDDPLLTVRHCAGDSPRRVVIDPAGRLLGAARQTFAGPAPCLVIVAEDAVVPARPGTEQIRLPCRDGRFRAAAMTAALAERGLRHLFIEGGGVTVSSFLAEAMLDRLQVTVAPLIIGSGRLGITLPEIADPAGGLRPRTRRFALGADVMVECVFRD